MKTSSESVISVVERAQGYAPINNQIPLSLRRQDSSVNIATRLRAGWPRNWY
jgi:hypothetical protein